MFLRPKRPLLANKARRRPLGAKATMLAKRMEALQEAEDARQVFLQCSGMHTDYVQWIIEQVCFRTWWVKSPIACADFVMPALTNGIAQHWENLVAAQAEIAVYASLFMTVYVGMYLGGFAPPMSTEGWELGTGGGSIYPSENLRLRGEFGNLVGLCLSVINIFCGVLYRLAGSCLPRESDKLVVMWAFRWLPFLNVAIFVMSVIIGLTYALAAGKYHIAGGNACMPDASLSYTQWYKDWVLESYPTGKGIIHPLDEPILNPWALAADAANISRPAANRWSPSDQLGAKHDASFLAYEEFMADHLNLKGAGCYGGAMDISTITLGLTGLLLPLLMLRGPSLYWFRPWRAKKDPYDLSAIYQEYRVRAKIGKQMADKDKNGDGFVKPEEEGIYVLESATDLLRDGADAPSPIALDEPVLAALQRAAVDPEDLRPYAEDTPLRDHRLLHTMLQDAGVADLSARIKTIKALIGAEATLDGTASDATDNRPASAKANQVAPVPA